MTYCKYTEYFLFHNFFFNNRRSKPQYIPYFAFADMVRRVLMAAL